MDWSTSETRKSFVGIDADTIIAPDAIARMVPHFLIPKWAPSPAMPKSATA